MNRRHALAALRKGGTLAFAFSAAASAAFALWPLAAQAAPTVLEGVSFDERTPVAGRELVLNGTGMRSAGPIKGYVVALYLPQRARTAEAVVAQQGPKRIRLVFLMGAPVGELVKAVDKGVLRNLDKPEATEKIRPALARLGEQMRAAKTVKKGDVVDMDFDPARGLVFTLNGRSFGEPIPSALSAPSADLYGALLRAFVGEHPYQKEMRAGLLGQPL
jgi:Chalcone isomerase-like